jgi:hypothetical protein
MPYKVIGAFKSTGADVERIYHTINEEEAIEIALAPRRRVPRGSGE